MRKALSSLGGLLFDLGPYLWRQLPSLTLFVLLLCLSPPSQATYALFGLYVIFQAVDVCWRTRWLWPFCRRTWHFHTLSGRRAVVRYPPQLEGTAYPETLLRCAEAGLEEFIRRFGFSLRQVFRGRTIGPLVLRRLVVYVFPSAAEIGRVFGQCYGGTALTLFNAVVIPWEAYPRQEELLRHELAHLFAARWDEFAPPFLEEGLATWLQGTEQGLPIDTAALPLLRNRALRLPSLLDPAFFFSEYQASSCYVLAGSFTGFLIRRYGWHAYRQFYCLATPRRFLRTFQEAFGLSFAKAEQVWRDELRALHSLKQRMLE